MQLNNLINCLRIAEKKKTTPFCNPQDLVFILIKKLAET